MSSPPLSTFPTELDAGLVSQTLLLVSPEPDVIHHELAVYPESENGQRFRIVETKSSEGSTRQSERFLDLAQDCVIPLYTIVSLPRVHWSMEVVYGNGIQRIAYSFRERADAFRLQQYFTEYRPTHAFEGVTCTLTFQSGKLLGKMFQNPQYRGSGEVQLWWPETQRTLQPSLLSPMSSNRSSSQGTRVQSTIPEIVRRSTALSVQTDINKDKEIVVSHRPQPPVLVAFLQDANGYTMLKADSKFTR